MLINSFENQSNLVEWFEHSNHYSVVVTRHKDLKRTEYKIQKNDYVYDMLKVKGSVTALVTCAKSLADNFPPTTNTDNEPLSEFEQSNGHVVNSEGGAYSPVQSPISLADHIAKGSLAGESSPVAASSYPATSDTPFSYRDLNTIVHALDHYIAYISKSDLKELEHLNIDFESDRKASILRLTSFTERIRSMAASVRGVLS